MADGIPAEPVGSPGAGGSLGRAGSITELPRRASAAAPPPTSGASPMATGGTGTPSPGSSSTGPYLASGSSAPSTSHNTVLSSSLPTSSTGPSGAAATASGGGAVANRSTRNIPSSASPGITASAAPKQGHNGMTMGSPSSQTSNSPSVASSTAAGGGAPSGAKRKSVNRNLRVAPAQSTPGQQGTMSSRGRADGAAALLGGHGAGGEASPALTAPLPGRREGSQMRGPSSRAVDRGSSRNVRRGPSAAGNATPVEQSGRLETPLLAGAGPTSGDESSSSSGEDSDSDVEKDKAKTRQKAGSAGAWRYVCQSKRCKIAATLCTAFVLLGIGGLLVWIFVFDHARAGPNTPVGPKPPSDPSVPWTPIVDASPNLCYNPPNPFNFWNGLVADGQWYHTLDVNVATSFTPHANPDVKVNVDWTNHDAIQLYANPKFLQYFDDKIRAWNHNAANYTGNLDTCGWPLLPNGEPGYQKHQSCFYEDFSGGWNSDRVTAALVKGCCSQGQIQLSNHTFYPHTMTHQFAGSIDVGTDIVEYPAGVKRNKNVLKLTALNGDSGSAACASCPTRDSCPNCHKQVYTNGMVQVNAMFASGKFEAIVKAPMVPGLIFAMWTYHSESHLAWPNCTNFGCYSDNYRGEPGNMTPKQQWNYCYKGIFGCCTYRSANRPAQCPQISDIPCCDAYQPCPLGNTLCDKDWGPAQEQCVRSHSVADPQFIANATFTSWYTNVNHEIDIEIPANCEGTTVCGEAPDPSINFTARQSGKYGCINRPYTANFNNYILTNGGGTGPAYSNLCVSVHNKTTGKPIPLLGDGKYHKYTIEWHTGGANCTGGPSPARTHFYVDDIYMGTNNVFVPTRGSRFIIGSWPSTSQGQYTWNNWPDSWGGGYAGDRTYYTVDTLISEIRVVPFNEPGDVMYPDSFDQPEGCRVNYQENSCHPGWVAADTVPPLNPKPDPGVLATQECAAPKS